MIQALSRLERRSVRLERDQTVEEDWGGSITNLLLMDTVDDLIDLGP